MLIRHIPILDRLASALSGIPYGSYGRYPYVVVKPRDFYAFSYPIFRVRLNGDGTLTILDDDDENVTIVFERELEKMAALEAAHEYELEAA